MSKKQRREQVKPYHIATGEALPVENERILTAAEVAEKFGAASSGQMASGIPAAITVTTDPQAIRAAMEDTVEVVSETVPAAMEEELAARVAALPETSDDSPDWRDVLKGVPAGDSSCPTSQDDAAQMLAGRDVAGKPSTMDMEDALATWGLEPADVLAWRGFTPEAESVLVTAGGAKLFWPADMDRTLTDAEKGRTVPQPTGAAGGVGRFTRKAD